MGKMGNMGKLTTHVLDTHAGSPAAGVRIELHEVGEAGLVPIAERTTGADGRCTGPLLDGSRFRAGRYVLTFHIGEYFRARGVVLPDPPFIDDAVVHFGIAEPDQSYHVPLLVTPWSYSVYRGS
jgi:5-hydroxyisourate hydrolase